MKISNYTGRGRNTGGMMRTIAGLGLMIALLSTAGCGHGKKETADSIADTLYAPRHASGFTILSTGGESSVIAIRNPWQGARDTQMRLFLARDGESAPEGFDGTVVNAPLKKVVCMSSSYIAFMDALGETDAVRGVSGMDYITNSRIRERYASGEVRDVGYDYQMNYETLAVIDPDLVLVYGVSGENTRLALKLDELGIKYFYIGDYVESSPLGKAEWLVAFGEMFGKREESEAIFSRIETDYDSVRGAVADRLAAGGGTSGKDVWKPVVMLNAPYRDTWYAPGDRSYMVRLVTDAGGEYACAGSDSGESRPISIESAYVAARRADVWLNPGQASTMRDVTGLVPRFSDIPAVISGMVFNNNARTTPGGGSDFWESGAVHPDIVLRDMVKILWPDMMTDHELYYFRQMR